MRGDSSRLYGVRSGGGIERLPRAGKKLLATGNGRCNLSHQCALEHPYHNAAFAKHALNKYDVDATRAFFRRLGILTVTDTEGRMYPMSNTAASVSDALRFECEKHGVDILCEHRVTSLRKIDERFEIVCADDRVYKAQAVILATGGKAAPVHGSDGSGFCCLRNSGIP
jgi:predicted Rossmann fold flavoprotein